MKWSAEKKHLGGGSCCDGPVAFVASSSDTALTAASKASALGAGRSPGSAPSSGGDGTAAGCVSDPMARANLRPALAHGSPVFGSTSSHSSGNTVCSGSTLHCASVSISALFTFLVIFRRHVCMGASGTEGTV